MRKLNIILIVVALCAPAALTAADDDLAVVVNKNNPVDNLTRGQIRKMLLGEQGSWPGGKKVSVILRVAGQPEREGVLRAICGMTEDEYAQNLMHANFNSDSAAAPKAVSSGAAVRQLVLTLPGAIGFLRVGDVGDSVKVVSVDGVTAGNSG